MDIHLVRVPQDVDVTNVRWKLAKWGERPASFSVHVDSYAIWTSNDFALLFSVLGMHGFSFLPMTLWPLPRNILLSQVTVANCDVIMSTLAITPLMVTFAAVLVTTFVGMIHQWFPIVFCQNFNWFTPTYSIWFWVMLLPLYCLCTLLFIWVTYIIISGDCWTCIITISICPYFLTHKMWIMFDSFGNSRL